MTAEHCAREVDRLRVLRGMPADVFEYFGALEDVPDGVFTKAVSHALKTRNWFPTPAELRVDCDAVNHQIPTVDPQVEELIGGGRDVTFKNPLGGADLTVHVVREWKFDCDDCRDTSWRPHRCPGDHCGRRFEHAPHEWVTRCDCVATNPTIQRRRNATAKFAQPPEKVGA